MKKNVISKVSRVWIVVLLAMAMFLSAMPVPQVRAETLQASHIERLEDIAVDYSSYVDSSVMFQLSDKISPEDEISVIITLDEINLMDAYKATDKTMSFREFVLSDSEAQNIVDRIGSRKAEILTALDEQNIAYSIGKEYDTLLSGFELIIQASDYEVTCKSLGEGARAVVGEVYETMETELVENMVNVYDTGIFNSEDVPYDGTGMVVAVLDTGLDSAHSAFCVENFTSERLGLTYEDVAAVVSQTTANELAGGLSVDDVYINEKVPYGYDYADNDPDVFSTHNNHGTHVSGVIAGKDDTITGVAPNAQLVSMKVFSDVMDTARSAWILSALEDCVVLGVDVINMSLGTACGFGRESEEELLNGVYDKIRAAGISMVVAASNSYSSAYGSEANGNLPLTTNPDTGTVGSPGTYEGVLSVASINGVETPYILYEDTIIYFDEANSGAAEELDFCETLLGDQNSVEMEYVLVPGVGRSADYTGLDVSGKIALVRRGDNTFEEKAMIAEAQGAAGIIIYNNVSGEIKMNVGDAKLAVCSISQNDGELLAAQSNGKIKISKEQTSGPFMSDFSSWGPTPSLEIKPEITAHGGNILSSITGGGYDRLSGTSMACPNLAGAVVLLRQYVVENFPDIADDNVKVNAMVNRLMMSTADIIYNTNGLPYAVRKQGAGLANLTSATETTAYITTYDNDGKEMDKTKLELGDDPEKTGVYEMSFTVTNFGDSKLTYELDAWVMTEGVSDTKTSAGKTTVTEEAYILEGDVEINTIDGEEVKNNKITVEAGSSVDVKVTLTLSDADKAYLDASFANGMYVEGFLTLEAAKGTDIDLVVPYLAFYGDWTVAPMFDLEYFDTHADELDDAIAVEDKTMADAYATRAIGGLSEDYVSYLGTYYFLQDPDDMVISANKDYIALSNREGTIHSLRFVWAGLLRAAAKMEITITDDTTGEVVFETEDLDVRKSYGDGGSIYPANVEIEFDTMDYNLANNTEYTVRLVGYMDYRDGALDTNQKNVFEFPLVVDFEAPTISSVEYYYEYDKNLEKNRLYAKVGIYDNHYTMSSQLGYVTMGEDENGNAMPSMLAFEQYMTPVYSQRNSTTYVTYELTDYIYDIKGNAMNEDTFVLTLYDYALNYATYEIDLPDNYTDFYFDSMAEEGITLSPNEIYTMDPLVNPNTEWAELLEFTSSRPSVARVVNNKIVAVSTGTANIKVRDPETNKSVIFPVTVLGEEDEGYRRYDKPVADVFELTGYDTVKAYYILDSEDKEIGDTGNTRFFEGNFNLSMYPSEAVTLNYNLDAYFPNETTVVFESSNDSIVEVYEDGTVIAVKEGFASVTIKVLQNDRSTYYSETVSVEVKDPYVTNGASLTHYYGNGGLVSVPEDLSLKEIGNFAFANFDYVAKTEEELAFDDAETTKQWYIGESTITKVILPEGIEKIGAYAFANLTALEEIVLPSTLEAIDYGAFYGCTSLEKISFSGENNLKIINQSAFESCDLQEIVDLSAVCVISDYAFAGNQNLEGFTTSDSLLSIGQYAFAGCKKLSDVTIVANKVKYGAYAFTGCDSLKEFYVNASVLPEGMFYEAKKLEKVTIGPDVNDIGEFAFRSTDVESFTVESGNQAFKAQTADYILSADGTTLVAVSPVIRDAFTSANLGGAKVTALANGAFSHNVNITSVELPEVTVLGDYAFGSSEQINAVKLGALTKIGEYAFFETGITELPSFTADTEIGKYAFSFTHITSVTIPDGMVLAEGVFAECVELAEVTIGDDVTIGDYAFSVNKDTAFSISSYMVENLPDEEEPVEAEETVPEETVAEEEAAEEEAAEEEAAEETEPETTAEEETEHETRKSSGTSSIAQMDSQIEGSDKEEEGPAVVDVGKRFYYEFATALTSLTIGDNVKIGESAFQGAASLETVTLGQNAEIGNMAFYNNDSLKEIDLSTAKSIGDYAFSGDVYYVCLDDAMSVAAISPDGYYIYTYHAPNLESIAVSAAESIGEYAFAYCRELKTVTLNENITEIPQYAFAGCIALENIDMSNIETIGDYAFIEDAALVEIDLPIVETVGEYAFIYNDSLTTVKLNPEGTDIGEAAFSYCEKLANVENLNRTENVGDYAFAYTAITEADLTAAVSVGKFAFLKETITPFRVILGEDLEKLGDNPFAMCRLEPFAQTEVTDFNGTELVTYNYTYNISDSILVIDGSLYCMTENGMELIAYAGTDPVNYKVAEDTVRIAAYAFAGSDVQMVTMPYTTTAIGHKAFYGCEDLHTVVFGSYTAPILEEEFDPVYYESLEHIPGTGDFGTYIGYDGKEVTIESMEMLPYFMWNVTDGMYSNVFYGANFVDYVGCVEEKLTMVRPVNGVNYDSFILSQYFDMTIDGPAAPDQNTVAAINAIKAIGERVTYEDRALVENARAAYTKIATTLQQALVTNYADLISAEQRITALTPVEEGAEGEPADATEETVTAEGTAPADDSAAGKGVKAGSVIAAIFTILVLVIGGTWFYLKKTQGRNALPYAKEKAIAAWVFVKEKSIVAWNFLKTKTAALWNAISAKVSAAKEKAKERKTAKAKPAADAVSENAAPAEVTAGEAPADEEIPAQEAEPQAETEKNEE